MSQKKICLLLDFVNNILGQSRLILWKMLGTRCGPEGTRCLWFQGPDFPWS